jgi:ABC-type hemin transport system substrate-binding protein
MRLDTLTASYFLDSGSRRGVKRSRLRTERTSLQFTFAAQSQAFPSRIVCLSDEASELLYLLGEQDRIVGVSGFSKRPPEVRSKPRVSTFRDANFEAIEKLDPDLIITYSDVQAGITTEAIHRGLPVLNFNQRCVSEIFEFIRLIARLVDSSKREINLLLNTKRNWKRRPKPRRSSCGGRGCTSKNGTSHLSAESNGLRS